MVNKNVFPENIDSRLFISDTDLEHIDLLQQYQNLLRRKKYNDASNLLENSDSFYYGASLFNLLEDRLHRIGQYLIAKEDKEKLYYQTVTPGFPRKGRHWIA